MGPVADTQALEHTDRWRARALLNRWIFRGMLFSMGSIAVVLHRVLP